VVEYGNFVLQKESFGLKRSVYCREGVLFVRSGSSMLLEGLRVRTDYPVKEMHDLPLYTSA
jgi:hypothetical protein